MFSNFVDNVNLFSRFIPVTLYLAFDIMRFVQFRAVPEDSLSVVRNSNNFDNLGQVDLILADKTGRLFLLISKNNVFRLIF